MSLPYDREHQAIRQRAFAIWENEGRPAGKALADWVQAEAEIKTERCLGPMNRRRVSGDSRLSHDKRSPGPRRRSPNVD